MRNKKKYPMAAKKILFERFRHYMKPIVRFYAGRGADIYVFDPDNIIERDPAIRKLKDRGNIHKHSVTYSCRSYDLVTEIVDTLFENRSAVEQWLVHFFNSPDITLALKKETAKQVTHHIYLMDLLESLSSDGSKGDGIIFFPERFFKITRILEKKGLGIDGTRYQYLSIPLWYRLISPITIFYRLAIGVSKTLFTSLFFIGSSALGRLLTTQREKSKSYKYAFTIHIPEFQLKFKKGRKFDFLLDGKTIHKKNSLFLLLAPLDAESYRLLMADGYNTFNVQNIFTTRDLLASPLKYMSILKDVPLLKSLFRLMLCSYGGFRSDVDTIQTVSNLVYTRIRWEIVLKSVSFDHLITFNDESPVSIARNCFLSKSGIQTWHYAHSNSFGYITLRKGETLDRVKTWYFSYLLYDHVVLWNNLMKSFFQSMVNRVGNYHVIGCLWSSITQDKYPIKIKGLLQRELFRDLPSGTKVVSFFGGTIMDHDRYLFDYELMSFEEGILFYQDILRLLEEFENLYVTVKDKKDSKYYTQEDGIFYTPKSSSLAEAFSNLRSHPRCSLFGHEGDTSWIIGLSDAVVSCAFASPAIEALAAGRKAFFYDPGKRFRGSLFESIGLVAYGYDELRTNIEELLSHTGEDGSPWRVDENTREIIGPDDGQSLNRFRELLVAYDG